jgi:diguanylate cyclase (GGDEF)-like protein
MYYHIVPYSIAEFVTAVVAIIVALLAWHRRTAPGGLQLSLLMFAIFEWALCASFEAAAVEQGTKIFWSQIEYIGAHTAPAFLVLFALRYTQNDKWLKPWLIALLFLPGILTIGLAFTNQWHHLIWTGFDPGPSGSNSLIYEHGPWFWVEILIIYAYLFYVALILIRNAMKMRGPYQVQTITLILASITPWVGVLMYLVFNPFPGLDLTCISFTVTGAILLLSMQHFQLLDLAPIARETLVENMKDGIIVLDDQNRLIDFNATAQTLFPGLVTDGLGQNISMVLADKQKILDELNETDDKTLELPLDDATWQYADIQIAPIRRKKNKAMGKLVIFRDATSRKLAEIGLQQANQRLQSQLNEINQLQVQLRDQAMHDMVTGMLNRRYLEEVLDKEITRAKREGYSISLVMVDIDHFKMINDTFGHKAGDQVLQALSALLCRHIRKADIACRYGGDEFVLALPNLPKEIALQRVEVWRIAFQDMRIESQDKEVSATISSGIAFFPDNGSNSDQLIAAADKAMYEAKTAGRNRTVLADSLPPLVIASKQQNSQ